MIWIAKVLICWTIWLPFVVPVARSNHPDQQQRIIVAVHLDTRGKVIDAIAENGNSLLFERAIEVAKEQKYRGDCDPKGGPIPSTIKISILFDENGRFTTVEFPIIAGDKLFEHKTLKKVDLEYPDKLRRAGIKGIVILEVHVDKQGERYRSPGSPGDPQLAAYAVKAVLQWKYRPVYLGCEAVPVVAAVIISFPK
jgi:TonB family protein